MLKNTVKNWFRFASAVALLMIFSAIVEAQSAKYAANSRYILRPGDEITVQYRYTPEFDQSLKIQPDGFVALGLVGEVKVSGLTIAEAQALIAEKAKFRLKDPEVGLMLKDFEIPHFLVGGEVMKAGKFELRGQTSALQAVLLAGGFSSQANTSRLIVFRRVNPELYESIPVKLGNISKSGEQLKDLLLQPGDLVLVQSSTSAKLERFVKAANLGLFLNPLQFIGN
jgi:polysaccharide biosynthesis/export protein